MGKTPGSETMDDLDNELIENPDGSVDIPDEELEVEVSTEFQENLAETLSDSELNSLGTDLVEDIDRDRTSRQKRDKQYEEGLRRTGLGDDAPGGADFEGATNVVHPVMAEACIDFAARAVKELFPPQGPVKTSTIGMMNEAQLDRAERKRTYMNWQLTTQMQEYRSELEQLLTQLPLGGSQFQKLSYDDQFNRPTSEFIPIDDILIPYSAKSFYTAQRVTHVQHITQSELEDRVASGLYRDVDVTSVGSTPELTASAEANEKIEGKEDDAYNEDGLRDVYEIYTWRDLEEAYGKAPYIITVDAYSEKVLSIYRNWDEADEKKEKLDWIVEWKFIPWRGAYAIGFPQIIGSLSAAATGALRALLDSAHINNLPGLIKLKTNKTNGKNIEVSATGITDIEGPAGVDDIRKLLMAMPFNPPSPILFQLLGWLTDAAKQVVRTTEDAIQNAGNRTPVGTTQAMIEQGSSIYSAIHARLHESQKKALQILSRINRTWLNEREEIEDLGKLIIGKADFTGSLDIIPVSDPAIFSEAQRYAQNQSLMQMQQQDAGDLTIPWNKISIRRRALKQMRIDNVDELLPLPLKPITADPLTESFAMISGKPAQAMPEQDHEAHINGHLQYLGSPVVLQNPLLQGPQLMPILQHVQQHIQFYEQVCIAKTVKEFQIQGVPGSPDQLIAKAIEKASEGITSILTPVMQKVTELFQVIQHKMPPPQMPPEVQASIQIAKMDIERKTQMDKASIELKQTQEQAKQALSQAELKLDAMQNQFNQYLDQQRLALDDRTSQLSAQLELMNNRADNEQKQVTELLKNRDDNDTKMKIALHEGFSQLREQITPPTSTLSQPDLSPHLEKLTGMLDQIGKTRTDDALMSVVDGLRATIETLQRPRRTTLEKDASGKAIGAISTLEG